MSTIVSRTGALLAALALAPSLAAAADFATAPARGSVSSVRLLAAGPPEGGVYRAGVEISLNPQTVTYWRQPGEAGSPPVFDFSKSTNVAKVETSFPAPKHIDEAGTVVAGYDETVIFPLKVTPKDPKAPVTLGGSFACPAAIRRVSCRGRHCGCRKARACEARRGRG